MELGNIAKVLIISGLLLVIVGGILLMAGKVPFLGRLPGDIYIKRENFTFYFPLATGLLISLLFSLILWFLTKK